MDKIKILVLCEIDKKHYIDGNDLLNALISSNMSYLDYTDLYYKFGFKGMHDYIFDYIRKNNYNTIVIPCPNFYLDINFLASLKKERFVVLFEGDSEHYFEVTHQYYAQAADLVLATDFSTPGMIKMMGIDSMTYLGLYDSNKYLSKAKIPKSIDVSFVGPVKGKLGRREYIDFLRQNRINVQVFGIDSPSGKISFEDKLDIYRKSRINLSFSGIAEATRYTRQLNITKRRRQLKGRIFEIPMTGGFLLTEYFYGIESVFEADKEASVFRNKEELLKKIIYYLEHGNEREEIAEKGLKRALKDYDLFPSVKKLILQIDEKRAAKTYEPLPVYLDPMYLRNFASFRFALMFRFLKKLKFRLFFEELGIVLKTRRIDPYQVYVYFIEEFLENSRIFKAAKILLKKN